LYVVRREKGGGRREKRADVSVSVRFSFSAFQGGTVNREREGGFEAETHV
jgi:hypothetical protein